MTVIKPFASLRREANKRNESMSGGGKWRALDFVLYLVLIAIILLSVRAVALDPVRVDGRSMLDTFTDRDVMLVDRTAYAFSTPKRGDVVICYYPEEYYASRELAYASRVKRVIAVAGDVIYTENGRLFVNGEPVDEPYVSPEHAGGYEIGSAEAPVTISAGCVFVCGDNRRESADSRRADVGEIPLTRIAGKVRLVLYPKLRWV
ncbi:MAG: signal peptidase I [Clostridia bacterium]|nr:signal peptidase I [Clostridia bacterium]